MVCKRLKSYVVARRTLLREPSRTSATDSNGYVEPSQLT